MSCVEGSRHKMGFRSTVAALSLPTAPSAARSSALVVATMSNPWPKHL